MTTTAVDILDRWLSSQETRIGEHVVFVFSEKDESYDEVVDELREIVRSHYVAPEIMAKRLAALGAPATADLLREHLPTLKTARSGDFGEILATEFAERRLAHWVPVRRLRWKDGRNMALRGDDIVAIARGPDGHLKFLKGESKSYAGIDSTVVAEAAQALDRDDGRPTPLSVLFVSERLWERGENGLALELDTAVSQGFQGYPIEHLLFTVSGNSPSTCLSKHITECSSQSRRHAVGVRIKAHGEFIERIFTEL